MFSQFPTFSRPVFILGAGFSSYASSQIDSSSKPLPTLSQLSSIIDAEVNVPDVVKRLGDDLELWLTYLARPQPWIKAPEATSNHAAFLTLGRAIATHIDGALVPFLNNDPPHWLDQLVRRWHDKQANVITLNYDTLVESLTLRVRPNYVDAGSLYPAPIVRGAQRIGGMFAPTLEPTTRLMKLHGSVNWRRSDTNPNQPLYFINTPWHHEADDEQRDKMAVADLEPFIVPPILDKGSYLDHDTIKLLWRVAGDALEAADAIVVMGYSLPPTDMTMNAFLRAKAPAKKVPLYVVDVSDETYQRYVERVGGYYDVSQDFVGEDSIKTFAMNYCN